MVEELKDQRCFADQFIADNGEILAVAIFKVADALFQEAQVFLPAKKIVFAAHGK
jgi:hypothetical protein